MPYSLGQCVCSLNHLNASSTEFINYGYGGSSTTSASSTSTGTDYSQYYDPTSTYWQGYNAWQGYYEQGAAPSITDAAAYYQQAMSQSHSNPQTLAQQAEAWSAQRSAQYEQQQQQNATVNTAAAAEDDYGLEDHKFVLDVEKLNRETIDSDRHLYDALESSKWLPIEQEGKRHTDLIKLSVDELEMNRNFDETQMP